MNIDDITAEKIDALKQDLQKVLEKHEVDNSLGVTAMLVFSAGLYALYSHDAQRYVETAEMAVRAAIEKQAFRSIFEGKT